MPQGTADASAKHAGDVDGRPRDIARKLQYLCRVLEVAKQTFVDEMYREHSCRKEDVRDWLSGNTIPRKPSLEKLTKYWNGVINDFLYYLWLVPLTHFQSDIDALKSRQPTVSLNLPCASAPFTEEEINGLVGNYVTYRKAFANDGRVSLERLTISPAENGSRVVLDVEMQAAPGEDGSSGDLFRGHLFKLEKAYYIVASIRQGQDSRIRFLCFPVGPRSRLSRRWGMISGLAGHTKLPVAARIVIVKLKPGAGVPAPRRGTEEEVDLPPEDNPFICNDITRKLATYREQDAVLMVSAEFDG